MTRILVLDQEEDFFNQLMRSLPVNFSVIRAPSLEQFYNSLSCDPYEAFAVRSNLEKGSGLFACNYIRKQLQDDKSPLFIYSHNASSMDITMAFDIGVDDFIQLPIDDYQLRARIVNKVGRYYRTMNQEEVLYAGNFVLNNQAMSLRLGKDGDSITIDLSPTEFRIFWALVKRSGNVLTREQIISLVWGGRTEITDRAVDSHVSSLRKKLAADGEIIESVYGVGYRLNIEDKGK